MSFSEADLTILCQDEPDKCHLEVDYCFSDGIYMSMLQNRTQTMITISREDVFELYMFLGKYLGE